MQLLKFITCGSVDDGKSTLIGHILYDSKLLYADQEKALELDSKVGSREGKIDYSLLLDGLMAEREQGITIDVAYRYFTTDKRSFIVADTPGHEEYTRNMAVGASFADLAIILIDAKQGVLVQTKRHARICSLMGIKHFVFAVNKMDLVGYSKERFDEITDQINELVDELGLSNVVVIPVSATEGDNVTEASGNIPWYEGPVLLDYLETVPIDEEKEEGFYLPVQRVCRPNHTFRGFQGQIEAGSVNVGDEITVLPSNEKANVKSIHLLNKTVDEAAIGQPVTIQLDREVDVSRGCVLTKDTALQVATSFEVTLLWMDDERLELGKNFFVKLGTKLIPGVVTSIRYAIDVNTGEKREVSSLNKNEIAVCELKLADSIVIDVFKKHRTLGELILIDRVSNMTSACGVVTQLYKSDNANTVTEIDRETRSQWKGQRAITVEIPLSEDGFDLEFVKKVERELSNQGRHTYLYAPDSSHGVKGVIRHLNDAGILVLFAANSSIDTSVFDTTRGYYSNWFDKNMTVEEVASFIYRASSIHGDTAILGDYI
ncbi:sulfate adenylyltransferase subunit 1 [Pseudobutyrivibrio sp. NOR37]|uniref:sulfate adenylyltransferase n=1 Tax=Pseudobutyrivibrio xylanivorans TaxID=185007 RepID=A0A6M0LFQ2_PSEXY|nr:MULTISPECIES: GTP-binding protein [Pseudobutyrivibrio]NEX01408.1 GTP-binding protein [Pseudobutyrivibrio xylanivorans]SFR67172.1 sulfate adenylyltransferase subunit 1 [Pseudobutyrivibrio sp. NOR37]